jgi:hypothetical protein
LTAGVSIKLEAVPHHSKPVKAWAAERQDKIELFYLPSYSPAPSKGPWSTLFLL